MNRPRRATEIPEEPKSESATRRGRKIKNAQNTWDFSDGCVAKETLSIRELAGSLKFAG
jgi:hypothetical protein